MNIPAPYRQCSFKGLIGVAREDITPPAGIYARNWGASMHDLASGVHRPLTLTCLTFQSQPADAPLLLISADLGWWKTPGDEEYVRGGLLEALSVPVSHVLFCLTHTHAGPSISREDSRKPGGDKIEGYLKQLRSAAIAGARTALQNAAPAILDWRYGKCDLAANRDLPDSSSERWIVGYNSNSPADDTLLVGRVTGEGGQCLATLVNYACHPTTLAWENSLISPDYVGALREVVETRTAAPCLFLQGASGDLAPVEQYSGDTHLADSHGRRLGYAVLSTLEGMLPPATQVVFKGVVESGAALALWGRAPDQPEFHLESQRIEVDLPLKPMPDLEELQHRCRTAINRITEERLRRMIGIRKITGGGQIFAMPIFAWRLGDALMVGTPTEAGSKFQLELRCRFFPCPVVVMNIANGYASYLPAKENYGCDNYTVNVSPFQAGSLEFIAEKAFGLLSGLLKNSQA